ncbi:MAG: hypothetical protein JWP12_969 [Bacteroidetes bacterium]|nr:hypothetical protein [Bacteroidota bacterium]
MFINKSKIHFESKSQLIIYFVFAWIRCLSISQRYILKANHNWVPFDWKNNSDVYQ